MPTRRYVDVALGLLGADEAAELILQTVSIVFLRHHCHNMEWIVFLQVNQIIINNNIAINTNTILLPDQY